VRNWFSSVYTSWKLALQHLKLLLFLKLHVYVCVCYVRHTYGIFGGSNAGWRLVCWRSKVPANSRCCKPVVYSMKMFWRQMTSSVETDTQCTETRRREDRKTRTNRRRLLSSQSAVTLARRSRPWSSPNREVDFQTVPDVLWERESQ